MLALANLEGCRFVLLDGVVGVVSLVKLCIYSLPIKYLWFDALCARDVSSHSGAPHMGWINLLAALL